MDGEHCFPLVLIQLEFAPDPVLRHHRPRGGLSVVSYGAALVAGLVRRRKAGPTSDRGRLGQTITVRRSSGKGYQVTSVQSANESIIRTMTETKMKNTIGR